MRFLAIFAFIISNPSFAETNLSASEFEALSTGKTLYFSKNGEAYGAEHFFKGRTSKWQYTDGFCENGEWFSHNDMICFNYENGLETQCWAFFKTDKGYAARAEGAAQDEVLKMDFINQKPLLCKSDGLAV